MASIIYTRWCFLLNNAVFLLFTGSLGGAAGGKEESQKRHRIKRPEMASHVVLGESQINLSLQMMTACMCIIWLAQ